MQLRPIKKVEVWIFINKWQFSYAKKIMKQCEI